MNVICLLLLSLPNPLRMAQDWCITHEILDEQERPSYLARPAEIPADVRLLYARWQELASAPALADACRLPSPALCLHAVAWNQEYRESVQTCMLYDPAHWSDHHDRLCLAAERRWIWETAQKATDPCFYVASRRRALQRLRDQLGPAAYYGARLPLPVPLTGTRE